MPRAKAKSAAAEAPARSSAKSRVVPRAEVVLVGRDEEQARVARLIHRGEWPAATVLVGERGIGKQRLAWVIAAAIVCGEGQGRACGTCASCQAMQRMEHPDVVWYTPHASVGGGSHDSQMDAITDHLSETLALARSDALAVTQDIGVSYYVATIAHVRRSCALRPAFGAHRVVVIGDADRLSTAEGQATEAANGLLKLLEEPPEGTVFILTASQAHRLPITIRSRVTVVPVRPLPADRIHQILGAARPDVLDADREAACHAAEGCIGRAAAWLNDDLQERREKAVTWLQSALQGDVERTTAVKAQGFSDARGGFSGALVEAERLMRRTLDALVVGGEAGEPIQTLVRGYQARWGSQSPEHAATALRAIRRAYGDAQANGNPQLVLHRCLATIAGLL